MRDCTGLPRLAGGHVVQDVLHGPAVGESALPHLHGVPGALLLSVPPGAFVGVEEQHQLLLDQFPLLWISGVSSSAGAGLADTSSRGDHRPGGESVGHQLIVLGHDGPVLVLNHALLGSPGLDYTLPRAGLLLQLGRISGRKSDRVGVHIHIGARHRHSGIKICVAHPSWLQKKTIKIMNYFNKQLTLIGILTPALIILGWPG